MMKLYREFLLVGGCLVWLFFYSYLHFLSFILKCRGLECYSGILQKKILTSCVTLINYYKPL